ncbi:MAG: hypothetical protein AVDCRST_MAG49-3865 [uncultured Thermomicrobiales bacterium]|uniref:HNH endonuclease 5 domain-containing protein n=1 Tax=uncultured Thermomicrobiales bacterium TaxID=1645740 RepID=A0A6J4VCG5_9BACT|nr:MAG: hypothetical protein AVDCRST_MAG49-3865 [uncultured Thermomicrobiales bacterium]
MTEVTIGSRQGKRQKGEQRRGTCVYCGKEGPITRDHVVPQTLFLVKDEQMLTVPSCSECQQEKARGERDLRNYCNLEIGGSMHPDAEAHLGKMIDSANVRARNGMRKALQAAEEVILVDEADNEVGRALDVDFSTDRMLKSLEFVFRGLYYAAVGQRLPDDSPVEVTVVPWAIFPSFMRTIGAMRQEAPAVKGDLVAWWSRLGPLDAGAETTAWVLCVNDGVGFFGTTGEMAIIERRRKEEDVAKAPAVREGPRRVRVPRAPDGRLLIPRQ